eukprot:15448814-Alexandrium_andersonii.AAC.1
MAEGGPRRDRATALTVSRVLPRGAAVHECSCCTGPPCLARISMPARRLCAATHVCSQLARGSSSAARAQVAR